MRLAVSQKTEPMKRNTIVLFRADRPFFLFSKNMETQITIVNPEDYNIEQGKAQELLGNLPSILKDREPLSSEYESVLQLDIEAPETSKKAKELRLRIRDNRTKGIEFWHKNTKELFLRGGQFVDSIKRMQSSINLGMEEKLEEIERYFENKEKERKEKLKNERIEIISPFTEFVPLGIDFGEIQEEEFLKIFNGAKLQKEADDKRKEDEAEQERKRIEKEKEDERLRIIKEEREKAEKEKEEAIQKEREEAKQRIEDQKEKARKAKEYAKRKADQELAEQARRAKENEDRIKQDAENARLALIAEQKAAEDARIKAIEDAKKAKEEAEKKEREERERAEKNAKFKKWLSDNNFDPSKMEWKRNGNHFEIWSLPQKIAETVI